MGSSTAIRRAHILAHAHPHAHALRPLPRLTSPAQNGLFKLDPEYNDVQSPLAPGALIPKGPHGHVQEVTAPNVAPQDVLFSKEDMDKMDTACGQPQSLRAIWMADETTKSDELTRGWKQGGSPA